jgi:sugar phosphate isomerase/epimerase
MGDPQISAVGMDNQTMNIPERNRPVLSWFPVRLLSVLAQDDEAIRTWLRLARELGFSHVEVHAGLLGTEKRLHAIEVDLEANGLHVSMLTAGPDLVCPDQVVRQAEVSSLCEQIDIAAQLGAPSVRVTAGKRRPGTPLVDILDLACESLSIAMERARKVGIRLCLENHVRDRLWEEDSIDVTADPECCVALFERTRPLGVAINFDTSQPMFTGLDTFAVLDREIDRVGNVHAGDRRRGGRTHVVIGTGDVDFPRIFERLRLARYTGFISVEDGSPEGEAGTRQGTAYLSALLERYWGSARLGGPAEDDGYAQA